MRAPADRLWNRLAGVWPSLYEFAAEYALAGPPSTYVLAGWSLIMERFLEDNADLRNHVIRADGKILKVQLPFSAREVYLKTNARIFGLELAQNITAKVIRTQSRSIILKEIAARRQLSGHLGRVDKRDSQITW